MARGGGGGGGGNQRGPSAPARSVATTGGSGASRGLFPLKASPSSGTVPAIAGGAPGFSRCSPQGAPAIPRSPISTFAPGQRAVKKKIPRRLQPLPPALRFPLGAGPRHGAGGVSGEGGESAWGGLGREESADGDRHRLRGGGGRTRWRRWASSECRQGRAGDSGRGGLGWSWGRGRALENSCPGTRLSQVSAARPRCVGLTLKLCLLKTSRSQTAGTLLRVRRCSPEVSFTLTEGNLLSVPSHFPPSSTGPGSSASAAGSDGAEGGFRAHGSERRSRGAGVPPEWGMLHSVQPYTLWRAIGSVMDSGKGGWARNPRFRGCSAPKGSGFSTEMDFVSGRVLCAWLMNLSGT